MSDISYQLRRRATELEQLGKLSDALRDVLDFIQIYEKTEYVIKLKYSADPRDGDIWITVICQGIGDGIDNPVSDRIRVSNLWSWLNLDIDDEFSETEIIGFIKRKITIIMEMTKDV